MSDNEQPEGPANLHISVIGPHDTGGIIEIDARPLGGPAFRMPTKTMGLIHLTADKVSWDAVSAILALGAALQKGAADLGVDLSADNGAGLRRYYRALYHTAQFVTREATLEASYELLREGKISRAQAATLAQDVLQQKISLDTWRKAVDKWAAEHGKPKLDLRHGRPIKQKPENTA